MKKIDLLIVGYVVIAIGCLTALYYTQQVERREAIKHLNDVTSAPIKVIRIENFNKEVEDNNVVITNNDKFEKDTKILFYDNQETNENTKSSTFLSMSPKEAKKGVKLEGDTLVVDFSYIDYWGKSTISVTKEIKVELVNCRNLNIINYNKQ